MSYSSPHGSGLRRREPTVDSQAGNTLFYTGLTPSPAPLNSTEHENEAYGCATSAATQHDEDEDGDDGYDEDQPYSEEQETPPPCAAYDPKTADLSRRAQSLVDELHDILREYRLSSKDIETMVSKAFDLMGIPDAPKKTFMTLGDTGVGKSSTTNSFVDDSEATKTGAAGESCTCVPTLLTSALAGQDSDYAAELCFMCRETRRSFLDEQVHRYTRYYLAFDKEWPEDQRQDYESQADTALKILQALFCDHFDFSSPGNIKKYFEPYMDSLGTAIDTLTGWCDTLLRACNNQDAQPTLRFDADSAAELSDMIQPYIFERHDLDSPALWPLIHHVRKGILRSLILRWMNILDLPGTGDTDRVRAEIANKFIKDSDGLWVVTTIGRLRSDEPTNKKLATYGERFGSNIAIIATSSDAGADDNLARDEAEKGAPPSSVREYQDQSTRIRDITAAISDIDNQLRRSRGKKRQKTMSDAAEAELRREKEQLETTRQRTENEQLDGLVDMRNSRLTARTKADKRKYLAKGAELSVFCVSNTHYLAHKGIRSNDSRCMSVEMTNIPALRRHALLIAAPDCFATSDTYINTALTLLRGATLWADAALVERQNMLMEIARGPSALLDAFLEQWLENAEEQCRTRLIQSMTTSRASFLSCALAVTDDIASLAWNTAGAFFRRYGSFNKPYHTHESWTERFAEEQNAKVDSSLSTLVEQQKLALNKAFKKIVSALKDIPEQLNTLPAATPIPLAPLQGIVHSCVERVHAAQERQLASFDKKISNMKLDATRDIPSGYFAEALSEMYELGAKDNGPGVTKRRLELLRGWLKGVYIVDPRNPIPNKSPFAAVSTALAKEFKEVTQSLADGLQQDIKVILFEMAQSFENAIRQENETSSEARARSAVRTFMEQNGGDIDAIESELTELKRQYGLPTAEDR